MCWLIRHEATVRNSNQASLTKRNYSHHVSGDNIHTQHNSSLEPFSQNYDPTSNNITYVVCFNFIHEWLKSTSNARILRNFFMAILFTLRIFERNLLKGSRRSNIFIFSFWYLAWYLNLSLTSNKQTHYLAKVLRLNKKLPWKVSHKFVVRSRLSPLLYAIVTPNLLKWWDKLGCNLDWRAVRTNYLCMYVCIVQSPSKLDINRKKTRRNNKQPEIISFGKSLHPAIRC